MGESKLSPVTKSSTSICSRIDALLSLSGSINSSAYSILYTIDGPTPISGDTLKGDSESIASSLESLYNSLLETHEVLNKTLGALK